MKASYKCIGCGTDVPALNIEHEWYIGVVEKITAGYGSANDMTTKIVAICDDCFKNKCEKI